LPPGDPVYWASIDAVNVTRIDPLARQVGQIRRASNA
jgi:hypothetical protein